MSDNLTVLVVGAGAVAREYVRVCLDIGRVPLVVTRGERKARQLSKSFPDIEVVTGGLHAYLEKNEPPREAILATPIHTLSSLCSALIRSRVQRVLSEKPLALSSSEADELASVASAHDTTVYVAFNRRHYSAVDAALQIIDEVGGVSSFTMDFTEAIFKLDPSKYSKPVRTRWGIANSIHVIDTAFYLCGLPEKLTSFQTGNAVTWHPSGSVFFGCGRTENEVPFSYHANWGAPGRWRIEINTLEMKLLFSPMEKLRVQRLGTFEMSEYETDDSLDRAYKPGFYRQTERFLKGQDDAFLTLSELPRELEWVERIFDYDD